MRGVIEPVQQVSKQYEEFIARRGAKRWLWGLLAIWLIGSCGLAGKQTATAQDSPPKSPAEQGAAEERPNPPVGPPARIEGFRQVLFGMNEEQVRHEIEKRFPSRRHPPVEFTRRKAAILTLTFVVSLPHIGMF